jgi:uncharacterized protein YndB with AHSA1/START domain
VPVEQTTDASTVPDESTVPDDEMSVVVTTAASASPVQVWDVLVTKIGDWWGPPYLGADEGPMCLEPRLGGRLWSGASAPGAGQLHGTVRAFDPPERLEIGGVLVPGAYSGGIRITLDQTALGSEIRIEHTARGRIDAETEERIAHGWTTLAADLADLAER